MNGPYVNGIVTALQTPRDLVILYSTDVRKTAGQANSLFEKKVQGNSAGKIIVKREGEDMCLSGRYRMAATPLIGEYSMTKISLKITCEKSRGCKKFLVFFYKKT